MSAEDHRLAVNTANVMGWETFREFHDCYLQARDWHRFLRVWRGHPV